MLTIARTKLTPTGSDEPTRWNRVFALLIDVEAARLMFEGRVDIEYCTETRGDPVAIVCGMFSAWFTDPWAIGDVEVWRRDSRYLAMFADQAAMKAGRLELATKWGDALPVGLCQSLLEDG